MNKLILGRWVWIRQQEYVDMQKFRVIYVTPAGTVRTVHADGMFSGDIAAAIAKSAA